MTEAQTFHYFEACGFVSEAFQAAGLDAAEAHVLATFRNPADPDFDGDDGGIVGLDADGDWWECLMTFAPGTARSPYNEARLAAMINALTGPDAPTPGGP